MAEEEVQYDRNPDFICRRIVDELLLVPVRQETADLDCVYTMNEIGAFIWDRLSRPATLTDLQESIVEASGADPQVVAADLLEFVQELESIGAVRRF